MAWGELVKPVPDLAKWLTLAALSLAFAAGCSNTQIAAPSGKQARGSQTASQGYYKVGKPYQINGQWYYPKEEWDYEEAGIASWYGPGFHGRMTANGEPYDMNELTAAHKTLPMPSLVRVTNLENGRSIVVRVNDRGPYVAGRVIDLSRRSAQLLDVERAGTAKVRVQILGEESKAIAEAAKRGDTSAGEIMLASLNGAGGAASGGVFDRSVASVPMAPVAQPAVVSPPEVSPPIVAAPAVAVVDERQMMQQQGVQTVPGASVAGRFVPAPVVTQEAVKPTRIYVQAGAFTMPDNATRLRSKLDRIATAAITPVMINGQQFYRVRLGPVQTVEQADTVLAQVIAGGAVGAKVVVE